MQPMQTHPEIDRISTSVKMCVILLLFFLHFGKAVAQESNGAAGLFLRVGVGARALAMGGAFVGLADDPSATYWNPAGLHQIQNLQFEFMNMNLPFDRTFNFLSTVLPIKNIFTLGVSWIGLRVNEIEGRSSNSAEPEFTFSSHQNAIFISLAKSLNSVLSVGGNIKIIKNELNNLSATGLGFDASLLLHPFNQVKLGLLVQDIGTDYRWNGGYTEGVPLNYNIGLSWQIYNGVTVAAEVHKTAGMTPEIRLGGEVRPINAFPIRMGLNDKQFSGGAGFVLPLSEHLLELNYSFSNDKVFNDAIHRFSLIFSFGGHSDHFSSRRKKMNQLKKMAAKNADEVKYMIIVNVKVLNVRSGPGKKFRKIGQILKGQKFEAFEKSGNWRKIKLNSSTVGWVHENYVSMI